jgi:hypothetical protein
VPRAERWRQPAAARRIMMRGIGTLRLVALICSGVVTVSVSGCRESSRSDTTHLVERVAPPATPVPAHAPIPVPGWPDSTFVPTPGWGLPHGGAWTPTQRYHGDGWTIEYPASARAEWREASYSSPPRLIISELPKCSYPCIVTVSVHVDSTAAVVDTVASGNTAADTTRGNAGDEDDDDEFRVLDTLDVEDSRGVLYEPYCGDCAGRLLLVRRGNKVAAIDYNSDDRNPYDPALLERLEAILRSFRWTESQQ